MKKDDLLEMELCGRRVSLQRMPMARTPRLRHTKASLHQARMSNRVSAVGCALYQGLCIPCPWTGVMPNTIACLQHHRVTFQAGRAC